MKRSADDSGEEDVARRCAKCNGDISEYDDSQTMCAWCTHSACSGNGIANGDGIGSARGSLSETQAITDQTYEGWSNRETWCANLWLSNDQGLYLMTLELARESLQEAEPHPDGIWDRETNARSILADRLRDTFEEWEHGEGEYDYTPTPELYKMLRDIGSTYRIDWLELAADWIIGALDEEEAEQ